MPPRAAPGDRKALEAALGPHRTALAEACRLFRVPADRWTECPALERVFAALAVSRRAEALQADEGLAQKPAVERASVELGVNPDTVVSRLRRWVRHAHRVPTS